MLNLRPANSGIGFELAAQLLSNASNHVLLGSRSVEKGKAAVKELQSRNLPGTVELIQIDVASEDSIFAAAKEVESKHARYETTLISIRSTLEWLLKKGI